LLAARAIECQCYVIAAAQCGRHNGKRHSYGHSVVIDPWGTIVADAGGEDEDDGDSNDDANANADADELAPKVVCCDVDLSAVESIRQRMPVQSHRSSAQWRGAAADAPGNTLDA
jgi:deaminated glutathione amidase